MYVEFPRPAIKKMRSFLNFLFPLEEAGVREQAAEVFFHSLPEGLDMRAGGEEADLFNGQDSQPSERALWRGI